MAGKVVRLRSDRSGPLSPVYGFEARCLPPMRIAEPPKKKAVLIEGPWKNETDMSDVFKRVYQVG